jgi:hypothetical protein
VNILAQTLSHPDTKLRTPVRFRIAFGVGANVRGLVALGQRYEDGLEKGCKVKKWLAGGRYSGV